MSLSSAFFRAKRRIKCFDAHFHIIDDRFPLFINQGYIPPIFRINNYMKVCDSFEVLDICGGAIVSGSFQLYDQSYLTDALSTLGSKTYTAVTQLEEKINVDDILKLQQLGVGAIRYNITRGVATGVQNIEAIESQALDVFSTAKWHAEFYIDFSPL